MGRRQGARSSPVQPGGVLAIALFTLVLSLLGAHQAIAVKDDLNYLSRATGQAGAAGEDGSYRASISADGRFVAFESDANSLSGEDNDSVTNIFVRDIQSGTTTYVSRATGQAGTAGDGSSVRPSISADGRFVAFQSNADNLSGDDDDAVANIFVRDIQSGTTTYASRATGPAGTAGDGFSLNASISADGRFVAFQSFADSLSSEDIDSVRDIFVRDIQSATTTYVSRATGPAGTAGDGHSSSALISTDGPSISADGRFVAFDSDANNLSSEDNDAVSNIFVRDIQSATTTYVSRATGPGGTAGDGDSLSPSISADGRFVAFDSDADSLSATEDNNAFSNIFVRDIQSGTTTYVSRATGPGGTAGDGSSVNASISADGRFVAFDSAAPNLSDEDDNTAQNIFVRDIQSGTTTYLSRASSQSGTAGDDSSFFASISADGRFVAFESDADSLSGEDDNAVMNIFRRTIGLDPPVNLVPPVVTGQPVSGQTLSCSDGQWTDGTISRVWRRDGVAIPAATAPTYTLTTADVGKTIDCLVIATNSDGSASETSNALLVSAVVTPDTTPPSITISVADGKLKLNKKGKPGELNLNPRGKGIIVLKGSPTEASPPITGELQLKTAKKIATKKGKKKVLLAEFDFSLDAGEKKRFKVQLSKPTLKLLKKEPAARESDLSAKFSDAAGNTAKVAANLKIQPA